MPSSKARSTTATACDRGTPPPNVSQDPSAISETVRSLAPSRRYSTIRLEPEAAVDRRQLVGREVEPFEGAEVLLELLDAARADDGGGDPGVAQRPRQRHLGERLATFARDDVEQLHL